MAEAKREIIFSNDLDGVHFRAPSPWVTRRQLRMGELRLPEEEAENPEYIQPRTLSQKFQSAVNILAHRYRRMTPDGIRGIQLFKEFAAEAGRRMTVVALSGREQNKHKMTIERLKKVGLMEYFDEVHLNKGKSATIVKQNMVKKWTAEGLNVVHIDDDLRPSLCMARVGLSYEEPRVLIYLLKNASNHPALLERAGVVLPDNLKLVPSFEMAAIDFMRRLKLGKI